MLILCYTAFLLLKIVIGLTSADKPKKARLQTIGIATAVAGISVNAFFSFPFQRPIPPLVLMVFVAMLASLYAGEEKRCFTLNNQWLILCGCITAFAVLPWGARFHYLGIKSDHHYLNVTRLEKMQNWPGVIEEARWAYHYNPDRVKTLSYMGRAYIEMGKFQEGISVLEKVINAFPNHMNALLNIGVAYGSLGNYEAALETYDRVLIIKPDYSKVHNNLANIYMKQNLPDKAITEFRLAAEYDPLNSVIHFNVGIVEMQRGKYIEAAEAFEKAIELDPKWDLAHKNLGVIYFQYLNNGEKGVAHLKKSLTLNPKIEDADQIKAIIGKTSLQNPEVKK